LTSNEVKKGKHYEKLTRTLTHLINYKAGTKHRQNIHPTDVKAKK
jgi:hypothetical protein